MVQARVLVLYHGFTGLPGWRGPQQNLPLRLVGFGELINGAGPFTGNQGTSQDLTGSHAQWPCL